jgi:hypothetical protein
VYPGIVTSAQGFSNCKKEVALIEETENERATAMERIAGRILTVVEQKDLSGKRRRSSNE